MPRMATESPGDSPEYEELVSIINSRLSAGPLGVEILHDPSLLSTSSLVEVVDNTIGVPRVVLAKAFVTARRIFFEHLDTLDKNLKVILDSSSIILLFDPEHNTAANARKRVCMAYRTLPKHELARLLTDELWFTEFLLASKLKRHNKSPTLWSHRKWLFRNFGMSEDLLDSRPADYEISNVVLISAEHHPRNYYAWDYMRWWIKSNPGQNSKRHPDAMAKLVELYQNWCLKHISDTSGWSFLMWMLKLPAFYTVDGLKLQAAVGKKVVDCAVSLNLKNLSLWNFLKEDMAFMLSVPKQQVRLEYIKALGKIRSSEPKGSKLLSFAENDLLAIHAVEEGVGYDYE